MRTRSIVSGVGLTVASAVLFALAFPPASLTLLAWVALTPLFVALRRSSLGLALLLMWLWCLVAAYGVGDWFPASVSTYFEQPMIVGIALFAAVFTVMAAPYYMAFAWAYRVCAKHPTSVLPLLAAAAWVGAELGRGRLFTGSAFFIGNPWGLVGYSQVAWLPMVQVAAWTGVYGVTFAVVAVNALLAEVWLGSRAPLAVPGRRAAATVGLALMPAAAVCIYGWLALEGEASEDGFGSPIEVAVAQANIASESRWRPELYGRNLQTYYELSAEALRGGEPRIIFWPESAMTFFLEQEEGYRRSLADFVRTTDVELLAGGPREYEDGYFNSIYRIDPPTGGVAGRYDKQYLVPFAEYFPFDVDVMKREFGRARYFEHGITVDALATRAGKAGVAICNEIMLPEVVGERVAAGADYLFNPSNDTWINAEKYVEQQFDIATLRAIEQRRFVVRASTSGPSAIIDPWGRTQSRIASGERGYLRGEIRPAVGRSAYGRVGDLFAGGCLAVVLLAVGVTFRRGATVNE